MTGLSFAYPQLLALLLLLPLVWRTAGKRRRVVGALRGLMAALVVLAAARPYWQMPSAGTDLIVLVDRSASCENEADAALREMLPLLRRQESAADRTAVIGFGDGARVERGFAGSSVGGQPDEFSRRSDLAAGLALARSLRDPSRRTALLCLTDGFADNPPDAIASEAGALDMPFWHRRLGAEREGDVAVGELTLPGRAQPHSAWPIRFSLHAQRAGRAQAVLRRNGEVVYRETLDLRRGDNAFVVRDAPPATDAVHYRLDVLAEGDGTPQNDRGLGLVLIDTPPRALLVSHRDEPGWLAGVIEAAAVPIDRITPRDFPSAPALLAPYGLVVLEDCRLSDFARGGVRSLAEMARAGLTSLLVTGGANSFGGGGYHRSELDELLPVEMELQNEARRGGVALAMALDRSGSMSMPAGDGRVKMDLANLGAAEAIRLLAPGDEASVIAVDSEAHMVAPLSRVDAPEDLARLTLGIKPMGGGIYCYTALAAASGELRRSSLRQRHIILFADASDAEEQEGGLELAAALRDEGIGVSVVAMGEESDADAAFLKQLAAAGGGVAVFSNEASGLPALFTSEVIRIVQRGFIEERVTPRALPPLASLVPGASGPPELGGYNVAAPRDGATVYLRLDDEFQTPLAAHRSLGRSGVAALLFEVEGEFAGGFTRWAAAPELIASLIRRIAPDAAPDGMKLYVDRTGSAATARLELSPDAAARLRGEEPTVRWLGPGGGVDETPLEWQGPFSLTASLSLTGAGHYLPVAGVGAAVVAGPSATVSYNREFAPARAAEGRRLLARASAVAGGGDAVDITRIRGSAIAPQAERVQLASLAICLFVLAFLVELAGRRFHLFGGK